MPSAGNGFSPMWPLDIKHWWMARTEATHLGGVCLLWTFCRGSFSRNSLVWLKILMLRAGERKFKMPTADPKGSDCLKCSENGNCSFPKWNVAWRPCLCTFLTAAFSFCSRRYISEHLCSLFHIHFLRVHLCRLTYLNLCCSLISCWNAAKFNRHRRNVAWYCKMPSFSEAVFKMSHFCRNFRNRLNTGSEVGIGNVYSLPKVPPVVSFSVILWRIWKLSSVKSDKASNQKPWEGLFWKRKNVSGQIQRWLPSLGVSLPISGYAAVYLFAVLYWSAWPLLRVGAVKN